MKSIACSVDYVPEMDRVQWTVAVDFCSPIEAELVRKACAEQLREGEKINHVDTQT